MKRTVFIGTMSLPRELYHYLCDTGFERVFKSTDRTDKMEFKQRMLELEVAFRNAQWEEEPVVR